MPPNVVGKPILWEVLERRPVSPMARFQEKENPVPFKILLSIPIVFEC